MRELPSRDALMHVCVAALRRIRDHCLTSRDTSALSKPTAYSSRQVKWQQIHTSVCMNVERTSTKAACDPKPAAWHYSLFREGSQLHMKSQRNQIVIAYVILSLLSLESAERCSGPVWPHCSCRQSSRRLIGVYDQSCRWQCSLIHRGNSWA